MKATEIKDFTSGNITKQLIIFSLPLFLSNLLQVVYNMVDMLIVGFALGNPGISDLRCYRIFQRGAGDHRKIRGRGQAR